MNWQEIIVGVLFAAAVFYVYKSMRKSSQGKACESGACKCEPSKAKVS
ncbi:MAG: hypothetical protein CFE21_02790 [Bacteroidetes bacterium B1(2017)]|nr:MAG: hypothetical protein CFE21_02790 [Bacteroidetes bacterium B1(2017)]